MEKNHSRVCAFLEAFQVIISFDYMPNTYLIIHYVFLCIASYSTSADVSFVHPQSATHCYYDPQFAYLSIYALLVNNFREFRYSL